MPVLHIPRPRALSLLLSAWLSLALFSGGGCPARPPANALPPLELTASADPRAEDDFRIASEARDRGDIELAQQRFRAFIDVWPNDPLAPFARLEIGKLELARGKLESARKWFEGVSNTQDPALAERGRLYAAVAAERAGEHTSALAALRPLLGRTVDPRETHLVLDTIASAEEAIGDKLSALDTRDRELSLELAAEEREALKRRVDALVQALDPALELPRAYETLARNGSAWPAVARRLLVVSHERKDHERVQAIAEELDAQSVALSDELRALVLRAERGQDVDPGVIGAILPLSGRGREVGEAALHGLMLASAGRPGRTQLRVVYRDDMGDPEKAREAFDDLVSLHRVIAVIGPVATPAAKAVAERARDLSVPVVALSPDPSLSEGARTVYRLMPEPREEANALVRYAVQKGARRFALLKPEGNFGDAMHKAFEAAIADQHGSLVGALSYPATATSFLREAEAARKLSFDALILADAPNRIALLAPALAAQGIWSTPEAKSGDARDALFLVPALGYDASLARTSKRYLQGAVFSVPFDETRAAEFAAAYRSTFQSEPNLFAATAHDAYRILESALGTGATTREALAAALGSARAVDVVGASDGFSSARGPRRAARLERLTGEAFVEIP